MVSLEPKARTDCRSPNRGDVFSKAGQISSANLIRMLLLRAGDIESNPGPRCDACSKELRQNQSHLFCSECPNTCHKQEKCSGLLRAAQVRAVWKCSSCIQGSPIVRQPSPNVITLVGQVVGDRVESSSNVHHRRCLLCSKVTRKSLRPLICVSCLRECHKSCSKLSRDEQDLYIRTSSWKCDFCVSSHNRKGIDISNPPSNIAETRSDLLNRGNLKILQWNTNGLKTKMVELEDKSRFLDLDIIMIQETKLCSKDKVPSIKGYATVRKDRGEGRGGGLITFIKDDIPYTIIEHTQAVQNSLLEILMIQLNSSSLKPMICANVYCPPTRGEMHGREFFTSELPADKNTIIGGDLNAHSHMWDEWQPEDNLGQEIEDWMMVKNFAIANDGSATRVNAGTGGSSSPDVTLLHDSWIDKVEWSTIDCMGSDHLPILINIECQVSSLKPILTKELRWNWNKADFNGFSLYVEDAMKVIPNDIAAASVDARMNFLNDIIIEAAYKFIGKAKYSTNDKVWLTREIRTAIKARNQLRRSIATHRSEWTTACRVVKDLIKVKKEERWIDFLADSEHNADPNRIWSTIKSLSGTSNGIAKNETLIHNGKQYVTSKAKANAFMKRYASISRIDIKKQDRCKKAIRRRLKMPTVEIQGVQEFNLAELNQAIRNMKLKGALGRDLISHRFIKALGPNALAFLLEIYNESWSKGICPATWREAVIVPLLKKGKPANNIDSYRPVSLTSCIAKTMERMVANRLSYMAESNGWWCDEQAGFRSSRSCEDQILRLTQSISNGFQNRPALRSVLALLDFSKAFDTVWRNRLFEIMLDKGVPTTMVKWIRGFLCDRNARVRIDNVTGKCLKLHQGVPQGAVLSPLLFIFYINGIKDIVPEEVQVSLYADDIAIWAQHKDIQVAQEAVQLAVSNIASWSCNHKLILNPAKCVASFFSTDPHEAKWIPSITINDQTIPVNKFPSFLGISYDRTLSFRTHAEIVKTRVLCRTRILASLATKQWGWSRKSLVRVFKATIQSVLHYCGAGWQPWLAKSNLQILERAQNRALRVITGQLSDTPLECLRIEAEIMSVAVAVRRNCLIAWEKSARLPLSNPRRSLFDNPVPHRWKNRSSFSQMAIAECDSAGLNTLPRQRLTPAKPPPWTWDADPTWKVITVLRSGNGKSSNMDTLLHHRYLIKFWDPRHHHLHRWIS